MILKKTDKGWQPRDNRIGRGVTRLVSFTELEEMLRNHGIVRDDEYASQLVINVYGIEVTSEKAP